MKISSTGNGSTAFEMMPRAVSGISLLISLTSWALLAADGASGGKAYAGTALAIFALAVLQALGFVISVGIPSLALVAKRRLRLNRSTIRLTAAALAGIAGQMAAVVLIPAGPDC